MSIQETIIQNQWVNNNSIQEIQNEEEESSSKSSSPKHSSSSDISMKNQNKDNITTPNVIKRKSILNNSEQRYKDYIQEVMGKMTTKNDENEIHLTLFNGLKMYEQLFFICFIGIQNDDVISARNYVISFKYTGDYSQNIKEELILVQWFVQQQNEIDNFDQLVMAEAVIDFSYTVLNNSLKYGYFWLFDQLLQNKLIQKNKYFKHIKQLCIPTSTLIYVLEQNFLDVVNQFLKQEIYLSDTNLLQDLGINENLIDAHLLISYFIKINFKFYNINQVLKEQIKMKKTDRYQEILYLLVEHELQKSTKIYVKYLLDHKKILPDRILDLAIRVNNFKFLYYYHNNINKREIINYIQQIEIQAQFVEKLKTLKGRKFEYLLFFMKRINLWKDKKSTKRITDILEQRMQSQNNELLFEFMFTFYNPLKVSLLIIELLNQMINNTVSNKYRTQNTKKLFVTFILRLLENVTDETKIYNMLIDQDWEGRSVLYIIYENSFLQIIANEKVQDVIEVIWKGDKICKNSFLSFTTITQNFFTRKINQDHENKVNFFLHYNKDMFTRNLFLAQFHVWKYNIQLRHYFDQFFIIFFTIFFIIYFLDSYPLIRYSIYFDGEEEGKKAAMFIRLKDKLTQNIIVVLFFGVSIPLNTISNITYHNIFIRDLRIHIEQILDLFLAFLVDFYMITIYTIENWQQPQIFYIFKIINFVIIFLLFIRAIQCLEASKTFGPLIGALQCIVMECVKFTVIITLMIILFTYLFFILFYRLSNERFLTWSSSIYYLIESMFGQFDLNEFDENLLLGCLLMFLYLYVVSIIFVNVLVAILGFYYEAAKRQGKVLFLQNQIHYIRQSNFYQEMGCLNVMPIIWQFLLIPMLILYVFKKNGEDRHQYSQSYQRGNLRKDYDAVLEKLNEFYIIVAYLPLYMMVSLIFIGINLVILPFMYLKNIIYLIGKWINDKVDFQYIFKWIFMGFFWLLYKLIIEFSEFSQYMFFGKADKNQQESPFISDKSEEFKVLAYTIRKCYLEDDKQYYSFEFLLKKVLENIQNNMGKEINRFNQEDFSNQSFEIFVRKKQQLLKDKIDDESQFVQQFIQMKNSVITSRASVERRKSAFASLGLQLMTVKCEEIIHKQINPLKTLKENQEELYEYLFLFAYKQVVHDDSVYHDSILHISNFMQLHGDYNMKQLYLLNHQALYQTIKEVIILKKQ